MKPAESFSSSFRSPGATPEHLALEIARGVDPDVDVSRCLSQLDAIASFVAQRMSRHGTGRAAAQQFLQIMVNDLGFHGDRENYYDPRNSLLPEVLGRRSGLPILLCLLCIAIGRRIQLPVEGLGFPCHFMALFRDATGAWVLDPFNGIIVEEQAVEEHLSGLMGKPIRLPSSAWEPVSTQMLTMRILHNLRNAFLVQKNLAMVVRMLDFLIAVEPSAAQHWRERALLHYREGRWEETQHDLRSYFLRAGFIPHLSSPFAPGGQNQPSPGPLTPEDAKLVELYQESNVMLTRIN